MFSMHKSLKILADLASPDGGWGYTARQTAHLEPTCLALLALQPVADKFPDAVQGGRQFLKHCRQPDGSYRLDRGRDAAVWGTAMALFVESTLRKTESP